MHLYFDGETSGGRGGALATHITMRPSDDRGLASDPAGLRRVASILLTHGPRAALLGFRVADTHLHVIAALDRDRAGRFAQRIQSALKQVLGLPAAFEPARFRPIVRRRHLSNAMRYLVRQEEHHGTDFDLAHDGSVVPDLLGMRVVADRALARRVRALLPRLTSEEVRSWAEIGELEHVTPDPTLLVDAATAAFALRDLHRNDPDRWAARRAAAQAVDGPTRHVAALLEICPRTVQRLRRDPAPERHVRAVDLQLRHRTALAQRVGTERW